MKVSDSPSLLSRNAAPSMSSDEGGLDLGQVLATLRRRSWLIAGVTTTVALLAQVKALTDVPTYSAGFEILTKSVTAESEVISSVPQTFGSRQQESTATDITLDETKILVLRSPALMAPLIKQLQSKYPEINYDAIATSLDIKTKGRDILSVSFSSKDPQFLKDVLNILSQQYLQYSLEERQKDVRQGIAFVEDQLPMLEARVANQQEKLQRFRQQYNLIDPELQAQHLSEQTGVLGQQQLETRTQLDEASLLYAAVQNELRRQPAEAATGSAFNENSRYQKLLDQLLEVDSRLAQDSALYRKASPEIQVLQDQRRNLLPLLQQEGVRSQRAVASRIQELVNRSRALNQSLEIVNQQVKQLSMITREYTDIQRELQIATNNLNQFLAKREGLRIDASQRQVPWQLLTPPNTPIASVSSMKRNLALGSILGLLLGVGAALVIDRLSNLIHTPKEVKDITKLPLLGLIPFNKQLNAYESVRNNAVQLQSVVASLEPESDRLSETFFSTPFQESFRSLYTNLRLLSPDSPIHSVVITSPTPSNGKTTIATYLAQAAVAMGRRVLLVDADLRHPQLHHSLNLQDSAGLTDVISSDLDFLTLAQSVPWEPNLFVLPCGSLPPDPTRILASQSMQRFMEKAQGEFDLVIYDTPPSLGFADALLLSSYTDALLLVVRLHQLKRFFLEQSLEELKVCTTPVLGVVANASEEQPINSHSYYHYQSAPNQPRPGFFAGQGLAQQSRQLRDWWGRLNERG
ncbi:MAG TPA: polysaccharide biosynthesis tyrosine autokinase [Coleofasciculaceae cyanobacterium]